MTSGKLAGTTATSAAANLRARNAKPCSHRPQSAREPRERSAPLTDRDKEEYSPSSCGSQGRGMGSSACHKTSICRDSWTSRRQSRSWLRLRRKRASLRSAIFCPARRMEKMRAKSRAVAMCRTTLCQRTLRCWSAPVSSKARNEAAKSSTPPTFRDSRLCCVFSLATVAEAVPKSASRFSVHSSLRRPLREERNADAKALQRPFPVHA